MARAEFNPGWKFTFNVLPSGQHGLLHNSFFQNDSELNMPMISTNIFFRKDDGIKIFDHQASSSSSRPEVFCKKIVFKNLVKLSVEKQCRTRTQVLFCKFCKILKNTFFTEHLRWLLFPILRLLDSHRQCCKWISVLPTILLISAFLVLVGIFAFIFGKHKLSVASRRLL